MWWASRQWDFHMESPQTIVKRVTSTCEIPYVLYWHMKGLFSLPIFKLTQSLSPDAVNIPWCKVSPHLKRKRNHQNRQNWCLWVVTSGDCRMGSHIGVEELQSQFSAGRSSMGSSEEQIFHPLFLILNKDRMECANQKHILAKNLFNVNFNLLYL